MPTLDAVRTTQEVANRMNELFKDSKWDDVQAELFADDAVSIEPEHSTGLKTVRGIEAIRKKAEEFNAMVEEMHGGWVTEPIIAGNFISFGMGMDVTFKGMGRIQMDEIAVYEVRNGKIVKEQFFY